MCRAHDSECVFPPGPNNSGAHRTPESSRRRRYAQNPASGVAPIGPTPVSAPNESLLTQATSITVPVTVPVISPNPLRNTEWAASGQDAPEDESPLALGSANDQPHNLHIVGPAVTNDNQVLSDYLSAVPGATRGSRLVAPVTGNRSRPVLFTMVQKRPLGIATGRSLSADKLEMVEKLLEPYCEDVIDLYVSNEDQARLQSRLTVLVTSTKSIVACLFWTRHRSVVSMVKTRIEYHQRCWQLSMPTR